LFDPLYKLLAYYDQREDLQKAFPEVEDGKFKNLFLWASYASQNLYGDKHAYEYLKKYTNFYYNARDFETLLPNLNFNTLPEVFFIFGAGRSGTTLTKRILNSHSMIRVLGEGESYDSVNHPHVLKFERIFEAQRKWLGLSCAALTECLEDIIAFPIPDHDDNLSKQMRILYSNQPIIFLVRDVRDRTLSMFNMIKKTDSDFNGMIDLYESWIKHNTVLESQFSEDITRIENLENKLLGYISLEWKIKNSMYFRYKEKGLPVLQVKYEDLILKTKQTVNNMISFLNLPFENDVLEVHKKPHLTIPGTDMEPNFDNVKREIDTHSIGTYEKTFDSKQIDEILEISGDMMKKLDYIQ